MTNGTLLVASSSPWVLIQSKLLLKRGTLIQPFPWEVYPRGLLKPGLFSMFTPIAPLVLNGPHSNQPWSQPLRLSIPLGRLLYRQKQPSLSLFTNFPFQWAIIFWKGFFSWCCCCCWIILNGSQIVKSFCGIFTQMTFNWKMFPFDSKVFFTT